MSFWAQYVLLKEAAGVNRIVTLVKIEAKIGAQTRQDIETELAKIGGTDDGNNIQPS